MDFNDYVSQLGQLDKQEIEVELNNFYTFNSGLLQFFKAIDNQFQLLLNSNNLNAKTVEAILTQTNQVLSELNNLKFEVSMFETEKLSDCYKNDITKTIRYIKEVMVISEVEIIKQRFFKLVAENEIKYKEEQIQKEQERKAELERKKQLERQKQEQLKREAERKEQERLERLQKEKEEKERQRKELEERKERERLEKIRIEAEIKEKQRLEEERKEQERIEKIRKEKEEEESVYHRINSALFKAYYNKDKYKIKKGVANFAGKNYNTIIAEGLFESGGFETIVDDIILDKESLVALFPPPVYINRWEGDKWYIFSDYHLNYYLTTVLSVLVGSKALEYNDYLYKLDVNANYLMYSFQKTKGLFGLTVSELRYAYIKFHHDLNSRYEIIEDKLKIEDVDLTNVKVRLIRTLKI